MILFIVLLLVSVQLYHKTLVIQFARAILRASDCYYIRECKLRYFHVN